MSFWYSKPTILETYHLFNFYLVHHALANRAGPAPMSGGRGRSERVSNYSVFVDFCLFIN